MTSDTTLAVSADYLCHWYGEYTCEPYVWHISTLCHAYSCHQRLYDGVIGLTLLWIASRKLKGQSFSNVCIFLVTRPIVLTTFK